LARSDFGGKPNELSDLLRAAIFWQLKLRAGLSKWQVRGDENVLAEAKERLG